ncbi:MAG: hypothetical protein CENE_01127 [Candidatus Celerinatantimonas neptuna]|nr:MAG: hypothetical protein CENE_01127 [Candidatus Celerinatantimonas neptuna]
MSELKYGYEVMQMMLEHDGLVTTTVLNELVNEQFNPGRHVYQRLTHAIAVMQFFEHLEEQRKSIVQNAPQSNAKAQQLTPDN